MQCPYLMSNRELQINMFKIDFLISSLKQAYVIRLSHFIVISIFLVAWIKNLSSFIILFFSHLNAIHQQILLAQPLKYT